MTSFMSNTPTAGMETLLVLKKSDWVHSVIFKMATEDCPVLLARSDNMLPLEVFDPKHLVEYPSEPEAWLPCDGLKFYTDGSSFEGRAGSGVFSEELDLKASSFALEMFTFFFQAEVYAILACCDYCLRECMTSKTMCICSDSRSRAALLASSVQCHQG
jgi:hypothetical protein